MKIHNKLGALASLLVLGLSAAPSSALVIMLSDLVPGSGGNIETFLSTNFTNVTEIRHSNWANFNAAGTQDALNGTGAFAGGGAADVVVIGRSLSSGHYDTQVESPKSATKSPQSPSFGDRQFVRAVFRTP